MKIERIVNQNTGWGESKVRLEIVRAIEKKDGGGGASASDGADDAAGGRQVIGLPHPEPLRRRRAGRVQAVKASRRGSVGWVAMRSGARKHAPLNPPPFDINPTLPPAITPYYATRRRRGRRAVQRRRRRPRRRAVQRREDERSARDRGGAQGRRGPYVERGSPSSP